jgi:hypothetical protein
VRARARELDGVHVDARYRNSLRLRRRHGGNLRAVTVEQVHYLLEAGEGEVEVVEGLRQTDFKSRGRSKATGLAELQRRIGFQGRVVAVGDGIADRPLASLADVVYAPSGSNPALLSVATMTRGRRQRGLLEAVRREHQGPAPERTSQAPIELLLASILAARDRPRPLRLVAALRQSGAEVFRC